MNALPERPPLRPRLIVNADDFGQSYGVNDGVVRAYRDGIVTSASLMVRWPASSEAAEYARKHPDLSLGLHVDLGEWAYRDEGWSPIYPVVDIEDIDEVDREMRHQLAEFRQLAGRNPTHIDSHQHTHRSAELQPLFKALAKEAGALLREGSGGIIYDGCFYGWDGHGNPLPSAIGVEALEGIIRTLGPGITELGCHPGLGDDMVSMYRQERAVETAALCDPRIVKAIFDSGVELNSFHDVAR